MGSRSHVPGMRFALPGICGTSGAGPDTLVKVKRDDGLVPGEPRLGWVYLSGDLAVNVA